MVPTYLIIENHVTCSAPTMGNWIFFYYIKLLLQLISPVGLMCRFEQHQIHKLDKVGGLLVNSLHQLELISKESVLLRCFPQ